MSKQRIAELQKELTTLNAVEEEKRQADLRARMNRAIDGLQRSEQQDLRNMLTKHIQNTYDCDDE